MSAKAMAPDFTVSLSALMTFAPMAGFGKAQITTSKGPIFM
jgi:hypothetical protein